ncbi:MAG: hypothetical protein HRT68_10250 [Flavobacteriaceae bacterium]|nr:hypothetical protein [Flavobacteriaceae bacterium]
MNNKIEFISFVCQIIFAGYWGTLFEDFLVKTLMTTGALLIATIVVVPFRKWYEKFLANRKS